MPDKNHDPTETEVNEALSVLRRDYYADVRGLADAFREAKAYAKRNGDSFEPSDKLHEIVDGSQRVIYTMQAKIGLLCTDNEGAYEEDIGEAPKTPEAAMFYALRRDVEEALGADYSEIEEDPEEPQDEDWVTSNYREFRERGTGKLIVKLPADLSLADMWKALDREMDAQRFWPNVWSVSDHGNISLISRE